MFLKNEAIFFDLLKTFVPRLNQNIWNISDNIEQKMSFTKKLLDFRQKEILNFKSFLDKMNLILKFFSKPEIVDYGKF